MQKTNSHYIKTLLALACNMGLDSNQLLNDIGMTAEQLDDQTYWVNSTSFTLLLKKLWQYSGDESLGITAQPTRMGTWALACDYMLSAETLGELYRRGQHIYSYLNNVMGLTLTTTDTDALIEVNGYSGERDPTHFLLEFITVAWHRFACWAIDETIPLKEAHFTYSAPEHSWFYDELFQCPVFFEHSQCGFSFSKKLLTKKVCRTREELTLWLKDSPADLLYMPGRNSTIAHQIKKILTCELHENMRFSPFDNVCLNLSMSSQVVRRRLDEEGTSYQKIKDLVRLELIRKLLSNPDIPIADIAERSGFSEIASLSRAFKKWTGMTPVQYRARKNRQ